MSTKLLADISVCMFVIYEMPAIHEPLSNPCAVAVGVERDDNLFQGNITRAHVPLDLKPAVKFDITNRPGGARAGNARRTPFDRRRLDFNIRSPDDGLQRT
ncbi:hypothetical protein EVAR_76839_1 [Eumeta japonica]|uniref:Uncharacterized protein n=1 Tax=Eumeta variegata TaxID=151549 RepID=A0A4C1YZM4_EUMVA|nr:hypothetical protein EVAR_76839_1 [Eumeta japonica]